MNFFPADPPRSLTVGDGTASNPKLNDLSMKERESGIHDLHGVPDIPNESDDFVQSALEGIRKKINLNESITTNDCELLKFLRAENFNESKAAARFNRFLIFQNKLFGEYGKGRLSELNEEDTKILQSGSMQLLPQKDNAGRSIIIVLGAIKEQLKTSLESDVGTYTWE